MQRPQAWGRWPRDDAIVTRSPPFYPGAHGRASGGGHCLAGPGGACWPSRPSQTHRSRVTVSYRDIKADILNRIVRGDWKLGSPIPGEAELAESFGVARATVNRALRELAAEGLIERKRKSGSKVRASPLRQARFDIPLVHRAIEERGASYGYRLVSSDSGPAPGWLRAALGLAEGCAVLHLVCLHLADDRPYQHEDRWINLDLLPQARETDFTARGPNDWLVAEVPFTEVEIAISACAAAPGVAALLDCPAGAPLLLIERSTRWQGQPITHVRLTHAPGHRMATRY